MQRSVDPNSGKPGYKDKMARARQSLEAAEAAISRRPACPSILFGGLPASRFERVVGRESKEPKVAPAVIWSTRAILMPLARTVLNYAANNGLRTTQTKRDKAKPEFRSDTASVMLETLQSDHDRVEAGGKLGIEKLNKCTAEELRICIAAVKAAEALAAELGGQRPCVSLVIAMLSRHPDVNGITDPKLSNVARLMRSRLFHCREEGVALGVQLWAGNIQKYIHVLGNKKDADTSTPYNIISDLQRVLLPRKTEILSREQVTGHIAEATGRTYNGVRLSPAFRLLCLVGHVERHLPESKDGRYVRHWSIKSCRYQKKSPSLNARTALLDALCTRPIPLVQLSTEEHLNLPQGFLNDIAFELEKVGLVVINPRRRGKPRTIKIAPEAVGLVRCWRSTEPGQLMDVNVYRKLRNALLLGKPISEESNDRGSY